jgi:hypothetical protein
MSNATGPADTAANLFPRRFVFHGNAVGASVTIRAVGKKPFDLISPVHGQSSLPTIGGHSESVWPGSDPRFEKIISYGECRTQADGVLSPEQAVTTLSASVLNVRITNRPLPEDSPDPKDIEFRASKLALSMRSTHAHHSPARIEFTEPPTFDGMTFDSRPLRVVFRKEFMELATMAELEARFLKDRDFFKDCRAAFMPKDAKPLRFGQRIPRMNGYALCSIVRGLQWGDQAIDGHALTLKGFGTIYFGEMLINDRNRRISLVRIKLGCENDGETTLVEGDPNGDWVPPES